MKGLQWSKRGSPVDQPATDDCSVTVPPASGDAFQPVLSLLLLSGIDIRGSCRPPVTLSLSLLFHVACLGIIVFKTVCLSFAFRWHVLVTMTMKLTALLLWWVVNTRKECLRRLIDEVGANESCLLLKKWSFLTVAFMCVQPLLLSVRFFDPSTSTLHPACVVLQGLGGGQVVAVLLHEFASVYVNCSIMYAVALLYVACCKVFVSGVEHARLPLLRMFEKVLQVFRSIEDVLSPCILVVFVHLLSSLFKDMLILIRVFEHRLFPMIPSYVLDFVANALLTAAVILSAEGVQECADALREALLLAQPQELPCIRSYLKVLDDRRRIRLTAWGMFELRKPLLLTIGAWLVTYGVIILQFSS